jgi:hypothetical protein
MQFESSGEPEKAIRHYERGVAMSDSASYYVCLHCAPVAINMEILIRYLAPRNDDSSWPAWPAPGFPART